ncbi:MULTISPECIES: hypothetical protein [unclassified Microbacterium]|uniref:hypothetical protein n=1 Tax=unclassified Microbacterium TaxID=2609290 RepID=UPI001604AB30|nr:MULTISPECIES: hypothetical protein [unclassified Microbacterium]QNA93233.1 hypothetical protein G4G29_14600 [Microbacterium sp. Se63.02b]QYM63441.1 hypothetical protein K1X59_14650 [Microbacterium sp. Se5.02b]
MSIIGDAFNAWRECRAEYDDTLYAQYEAAEEATNGAMLNARGREKGVDPFSLFMGNETRALAYASEELVEHWAAHPRITFAKFEKQWQAQREAELIEDAA